MSFESEIRTYVLADSAISAIVGTRMHYQLAPQGSAYPLLQYETEEETPSQIVTGYTGLDYVGLLFTSWAETRPAVLTLSAALRARIGQMTGVSLSTYRVDRSMTSTGRSTIEPWPAQEKARRFGFMQPFTFWVGVNF